MTTNGTVAHRSNGSNVANVSVGSALLTAEKTGQFPAEAWPAIRDLLLASADPQLSAVVEPLRQLIQARQAVVAARNELDRGYAAVAAALGNSAQLSEAAANLSMLADELSARAQQLTELES